LPSATILVLASFALSRAGVAPLVTESVRLVALSPPPTIFILASFALSRAGVDLLTPESVRLVALLPPPTILLLTHSLLRAILARLPPTSTEFLAFAICTRLILIGLLRASVVLHDHNNAAYPNTSAS
jgi:hypothetical protein